MLDGIYDDNEMRIRSRLFSFIGEILTKFSIISFISFGGRFLIHVFHENLWLSLFYAFLLIVSSLINWSLYRKNKMFSPRWRFFNSDLGKGIYNLIYLFLSLALTLQIYSPQQLIRMDFGHHILLFLASLTQFYSFFQPQIALALASVQISELEQSFTSEDSFILHILRTTGRMTYTLMTCAMIYLAISSVTGHLEDKGYIFFCFFLHIVATTGYCFVEAKAYSPSNGFAAYLQFNLLKAVYKITNAYLLLYFFEKMTPQLKSPVFVGLFLACFMWIVGFFEIWIISKSFLNYATRRGVEPGSRQMTESENRERQKLVVLEKFASAGLILYCVLLCSNEVVLNPFSGLRKLSWMVLLAILHYIVQPALETNWETTANKFENSIQKALLMFATGFCIMSSVLSLPTEVEGLSNVRLFGRITAIIVSWCFFASGFSRTTLFLKAQATPNNPLNGLAIYESSCLHALLKKFLKWSEKFAYSNMLFVFTIDLLYHGWILVYGLIIIFWILCRVLVKFHWNKVRFLTLPLAQCLMAAFFALVSGSLGLLFHPVTSKSSSHRIMINVCFYLQSVVLSVLLLIASIGFYLHIKETSEEVVVEFNRLNSEASETEIDEEANRSSSIELPSATISIEVVSPIIEEEKSPVRTQSTRHSTQTHPSAQRVPRPLSEDAKESLHRYHERKKLRERRLTRRTMIGHPTTRSKQVAPEKKEESREKLEEYYGAFSKLAKKR